MSINISRQGAQKNIVIEQNKAQKQQDVNKQKQTTSTSNSKDSVQLTSQALNLNKMQGKTTEPKINAQRIESLKSAILNGDYKINTERLAEKLSKFEGDFNKAFG
jgi:negative regulator of flagellin synthesis FlgM